MIPALVSEITFPLCAVENEKFVVKSINFRMEDLPKGNVTVLLERLASGDSSAADDLMPCVYAELHRLAMSRLRAERSAHTLQATALVHEVYLRMCPFENVKCVNRAHFYRIAARMMRRILVDYARQHGAHKRNDGAPVRSLDEAVTVSSSQSAVALEVDELLDKLAQLSLRQAQIVEMRFYGGLTEEEIAAAIGKNARTVRRDWLIARAWLHEQLTRG